MFNFRIAPLSKSLILFGCLAILSPLVQAENNKVVPKNFSQGKQVAAQAYTNHNYTFYCGCAYLIKANNKIFADKKHCGYQPRNQYTKAGKVNRRARYMAKNKQPEHVVPAWEFGRHLPCWKNGGRKNCRKTSPLFRQMEADPHNLVPAIGELNADRSNFAFKEIKGEKRAYGACDFEVDFKTRTVEPAENIQGDIARTYFYMSDRYGLPISDDKRRQWALWHLSDPPSFQEITKAYRIHYLTGLRHPWLY